MRQTDELLQKMGSGAFDPSRVRLPLAMISLTGSKRCRAFERPISVGVTADVEMEVLGLTHGNYSDAEREAMYEAIRAARSSR